MVIVGLQCGHDASVAIISDGKILLHLERERVTRTRHALWVTAEFVHEALAYCGLTVSDVDLFALCTTQSTGYGTATPDRLSFAYAWETAERLGTGLFSRNVFDRTVKLTALYRDRDSTGTHRLYNSEWPDKLDPWFDDRGMMVIDDLSASDAAKVLASPELGTINVLPMTVTLDGRVFPAVGVMHQLSHAAAGFYQSGFDKAAVLAQDNGDPSHRLGPRNERPYKGGMMFYGQGSTLKPIWTMPIPAGMLYGRTARRLRLGGFAGPGKLMGLAAYGEPVFHDQEFVGDVNALAARYVRPQMAGDATIGGWFEAVDEQARALGYRDDEGALSRYGKDLASSVQRTFEELVLHAVERLRTLLVKAGSMGPALCISGGCALNCPTNSRIVEETEFSSVFVPPSCDDGGLSIGAALYVYHHMLGHPRSLAAPRDRNIAALGRAASVSAVNQALDAASAEFEVERGVDLAERAAADLVADRTVALFQGRAESGPRALGHRSLLADPRRGENWARVNGLKSRELWRPFAPACLAERLREHFEGGPEHSPHMLFNYRVKSADLGAVTHVDGTARTQTVSAGSGALRQIIEAFDRVTGVPVVLNTSLNGPGEPIVETPEQAVDFLRNTQTDVLYLEGYRVARARTA